MNLRRTLCVTLLAVAVPAVVRAQAASAPAPGPAASAPRPGMGPGMGIGPGGRMRFDADNTPGWGMMSPQEREAHHAAMAGIKTHDECVAYMSKHREQMAERAKQQGRPAVGMPRRDACAAWKK